MIKKWSYVAAMMLTASCGCLFTGCIDNDEPYGITQIRVATANLLEAKKAAVEAEAAAANAQVEVEKIKAEVEKAKLAVEQIKAEAEAAALKLQAEAAAAKTQAEADLLKAQAEAIIKDAEAQAALLQAQTNDIIAKTEAWIKNAEQAYTELVYKWEQTKIKEAAAANDVLFQSVDAAYAAYMSQLNIYNLANKNYLEAQRRLAEYELDLVWNPNGGQDGNGGFDSPKYDQKTILEEAVADAQKEIDRANGTIDRVNEFNEKLDGADINDLNAMLEDYSTQLEDNVKALAEANVEKDAIYIENKADFDAPIEIQKQIDAEQSKPIAIAPYTYEPDAQLAVLGISDIEVVPQNVSYNLGNDWYIFNQYVNKYNNTISRLKNYLLDENDKAWTNARVNEMTRELAEANKTFGAAKEAWETAKKVYNMGNDVDASALPLESELEAAIEAYNNMESEIQGLRDAVQDANEAVTAANDAYWEAWKAYYDPETSTSVNATWNAAQETCREAESAAWSDYYNAVNAANSTRNQAYKDANSSVNNAWNAYSRAEDALSAAINELNNNPDDKTLQANVENAEKDRDNALENAQEAQTKAGETKANATTACNRAIAAAKTARVKAINAAQEARDKAEAAWIAAGGYSADQNDPAYAPVEAAYQEYQKAQEAETAANEALAPAAEKMMELYDAMVDAQQNQLNEIGLSYWSYQTIPSWSDAYSYSQGLISEFPAASAPIEYKDAESVYANAKYYLIQKSITAYGNLGFTYNYNEFNGDSHNGWILGLDIDRAFLVDNVTVEMANAYVKSYVKRNYGYEIQDYLCYQYYWLFNDFGAVISLENRIAVANANLANSDLSTSAVATLEANLETLEQSKVDAEADLADLRDQKAAAEAKIDSLFKNVNDKIADLSHVQNDLNIIITTIKSGISELQQLAVGASSAQALQNMINQNKATLANAEVALENAQKMLDAAQYQLDQYNNGYKDLANPHQPTVDYLKAKVEAEKEYVDVLKAHLDDVMAIYEKATKE